MLGRVPYPRRDTSKTGRCYPRSCPSQVDATLSRTQPRSTLHAWSCPIPISCWVQDGSTLHPQSRPSRVDAPHLVDRLHLNLVNAVLGRAKVWSTFHVRLCPCWVDASHMVLSRSNPVNENPWPRPSRVDAPHPIASCPNQVDPPLGHTPCLVAPKAWPILR